MTGAEWLILGKLGLTFGVLLGLPVLDLWLMQRSDGAVRRQEGDA